jgi:D-3-phosphoglycerate dehydrogenase / 2-oxoglutarate reductase
MSSYLVVVSDSVFPNLDPARKVFSTIGAELQMAQEPTPELVVRAAAAADALMVTYAKISG